MYATAKTLKSPPPPLNALNNFPLNNNNNKPSYDQSGWDIPTGREYTVCWYWVMCMVMGSGGGTRARGETTSRYPAS